MRHSMINRWCMGLLALCLWATVPAHAEPAPAPAANTASAPAEVLATPAQLSDQLDQIRQKVSTAANDDLLASLRQAALQVQRQADALLARQGVDMGHLDDQLNVLGAAQPDEPQALAAQRRTLANQKKALTTDQTDTTALSTSAGDLAAQILNVRRNLLDTQISTRSASPLSSAFWSSLVQPTDDDVRKLGGLWQDVSQVFATAMAPGSRGTFIGVLVCALLVWVVARRLIERLLVRAMIRWFPEGRLRRSTLALATGLTTVLTISAATSLLQWGIVSHSQPSANVLNLIDQVQTLILFCAFIVGMGRALLMLPNPSWRLPTIPDPVATAIGVLPAVLALALMAIGTFERINSVIASSLALSVAVNGLTALVVSLILVYGLVRVRQTRRRLALERTAGLVGLIPFILAVWVGIILLGLLSGYLTLAYVLTVKLLWISLVTSTAYLLTTFFVDVCETLLSPKQAGGQALGAMLGLSPRHQAQASTLLAGIGRTVLLCIALILVFMPSGSNPSELLASFARLDVGSKSLGALNIVPGDILLAVVLLVGGLLSIRILKNWLGDRLLPETNMDAGMRASLVTLVGYIGFVLLGIAVLSTLRISLTNLTWVVSALSVGIGFGLQAIVQNFISGLILLTERPVKVGDWVSLAGVEGDIRRINVRATEIQMGDRSTVIVPNSQFITQNVRNVTMGNALGVVGITLTLPLDTDVLKIRDLLMTAYAEHEAVLSEPAPSVTFKDLTNAGLLISVSGFVNSPRSVGGVRSDLLFTILDRLRTMGVALSAPQSMLLVNDKVDASPAQEQPTIS
ncbi:mechanosensitive ion channel family protein [Pseudomonas putida]|nr:mechanosensitive ion channel family protein [Pseudomonas putida]